MLVGSAQLLTDPTFDPPGRRYTFGWGSSSRKLTGPAAGAVLTTVSGARRLGGNARGLQPWATTQLEAPGRPPIQITATPCRHGPPLSRPIAGDVIGFALAWEGQEHGALWITGDTVLYDGVRQVADRLQVGTALLHLGCVRFPVTGPVRYSMTAREAIQLCGLVRPRTAIPVHHEGWSHFHQDRPAIEGEFGRRQPTSAAVSAGYPSGRRRPSPRDTNRRKVACSASLNSASSVAPRGRDWPFERVVKRARVPPGRS